MIRNTDSEGCVGQMGESMRVNGKTESSMGKENIGVRMEIGSKAVGRQESG
jgi:hypothetical protein